jgi:methionyl aminopeptidase
MPYEEGGLIFVKSEQEVLKMSVPCKIVAETLDLLKGLVVPGITTLELDKRAEEYIRGKGGEPAFKGYRGFPSTICASVNEQVVHGIPSKRELLEGDIVSIDLGVKIEGFYGDAALTVAVGEISEGAARLMRVTQESLELSIPFAKAGGRVSDIGAAVQKHVEANGFSVVRAFVGHGIGKQLHEEPQVPNFGKPGRGPRLKAGMTLAVEPMVNAGGFDVRVLEDGWTALTVDGSLSAHFEHTLLVTESGGEVLTKL